MNGRAAVPKTPVRSIRSDRVIFLRDLLGLSAMSQEFGDRHSYLGACNARTTATSSPETATKANQAVRTEFGMLKSNTRSSDHV